MREFRIQFDEFLLVTRNIIFCINRVDWTLWNADCAVDTFVWIDYEEIGTFAKAVDRADIYTVGVLAADTGFGDNVSHDVLGLNAQGEWANKL